MPRHRLAWSNRDFRRDVSSKIKAALSANTELATLTGLARQEGMSSLRESAIRKMLQGETTVEDVVAITG